METTFTWDLQGQNIVAGLRAFLRELFEKNQAAALFAPMPVPSSGRLMPTLITDAEMIGSINPLAPLYPVNAAALVARLARKASGESVIAVLRPCELRALTELIKLKQATRDDLVVVSMDCLGAYPNREVPAFDAAELDQLALDHHAWRVQDKSNPHPEHSLAQACNVCEHRVAANADIGVGLVGLDDAGKLLIEARTAKGATWLKSLALTPATAPAKRAAALEALLLQQRTALDSMMTETAVQIDGLDKLAAYFARCVGCYNCRVTCPVCYCRECVFTTDVFEHEPFQYLQWARRKKSLPMPSDNLFFHITRLAHMSLACVGCGQCSNACPNEIPVMNVLRTVGQQTQAAFDYIPGLKDDQAPPLSVFKEDEFKEVVGL